MSNSMIVAGNAHLHGTIKVSGAKNEALKALASSILFEKPVTISNVPDIEDIHTMINILESLGASVKHKDHTVIVNPASIATSNVPNDLATKIRASAVLLGPLLARFGSVTLPAPGGDTIGKRPIDFFIHAFSKMGVTFHQNGNTTAGTTKGLKGATIVFPQISHTATESLLMAATLAKGTTILKNCAMEPEVVALATNLNNAGADIQGAGTPTITINGVKQLQPPKSWDIIPDRIETGTFAILAAATKSNITISHCNPDHLTALLLQFEYIGIPYKTTSSSISVLPKTTTCKEVTIKTHEYPGFPTDLQPQMAVLLTQCTGMSIIHETIFEGRLHYLETLKTFGANVMLFDPHRAAIMGPTSLKGTSVESPDIRAGIAFIIAALIATGETTIHNTYQIRRGYENIVERLQNIGATIRET